jgi:hypothetical protein
MCFGHIINSYSIRWPYIVQQPNFQRSFKKSGGRSVGIVRSRTKGNGVFSFKKSMYVHSHFNEKFYRMYISFSLKSGTIYTTGFNISVHVAADCMSSYSLVPHSTHAELPDAPRRITGEMSHTLAKGREHK